MAVLKETPSHQNKPTLSFQIKSICSPKVYIFMATVMKLCSSGIERNTFTLKYCVVDFYCLGARTYIVAALEEIPLHSNILLLGPPIL